MIVPSIDLQGGQTVQLIGGEKKAIDAGDPLPIARRFGIAGTVAVIDLDAAMRKGSNATLIESVLPLAPCRVGGGIRDVETARRWLDQGATHVILGTAAVPEILSELPKERVIAALDARHGEVVVEGWTQGTGRGVVERMNELKPFVGGFLVTFVEREGRMEGIDLTVVETLVKAAAPARLTVAGGVTTLDEVAAIDRLGADCQVGMALYTGRMDLGDAIVAPLASDRPDGLFSTVVVDERGVALGLCYSDRESVREAVKTGRGVYHSRTRGLWVKGLSSGDTQDLLRIDVDCDSDALRFTVRQHGRGFCHEGTRTCFGDDDGLFARLETLKARRTNAPAGSYTRRLLDDAGFLRAKLLEEAGELAEARERTHVVGEAADLLYLTLVAMARAGVELSDVERELAKRARKVSRRPGLAKPPPPPSTERT
jgi:phosphoribosyl-ATP pyrophosphohydrolase/phosphoribosyl-AMP cyclohydrolase